MFAPCPDADASYSTMTNGILDSPLFRDQTSSTSFTWVHDSTFGMVHRRDCRICRSYMMHLSEANELDLGYAQAVHDKGEELRSRFLEGFRRGRDTQRQHDNDVLKRYRSQRDSARDAQSLSEVGLEEAREEIVQLRDELLALRLAYDELRPHTPLMESNWSDHEAFCESSDGFESDESDSSFSSGTRNSSEELWDPVLASTESNNGEEEEEDVEGRAGNSRHWMTNQNEFSNEPYSEPLVKADEIHNLSLFSLHFTIEDESGLSGAASTHSSPCQSTSSTSSPPSPLPPHPPSTNVSPNSSERAALEKIRVEMKLASHPGNRDVLLRVKSLVSEAQRTPSYKRTEIQKVLIKEWRRPTIHPLTWNPPLSISPSDVYVDASQKGIGFVFGDRWQAWKLKEGWKAGGREIQWAEAAAVELGLRLMIQAGVSGKALRLRSDNSGVVDAVSKRQIHQSQFGTIIQNIHHLCQLHEITLEIKWIAGEHNPADSPSRLRPNKGSPRFSCTIQPPPHLQAFVLPFSL